MKICTGKNSCENQEDDYSYDYFYSVLMSFKKGNILKPLILDLKILKFQN
jgi:hypothetical protein